MNSNYNMLEIAIACGYKSQNYYNINFKKITGITPLEFKRAIGKI